MAYNGILNRLWEPLLFFLSPFMHPLPVRVQHGECCSPSLQRSIWHFAFPLHYFNIKSPPHNPITVKNVLWAHHCLVFSFFSRTMSCSSEMRQRIGGNKTRGRETHWTKDEMMRKKEGDRAEERAGRKENWDMRLFDLKGSIRGIKAGKRLRNSKKWEERSF